MKEKRKRKGVKLYQKGEQKKKESKMTRREREMGKQMDEGIDREKVGCQYFQVGLSDTNV